MGSASSSSHISTGGAISSPSGVRMMRWTLRDAGRDPRSENPGVGHPASLSVARDWELLTGSVSMRGLRPRLVLEAWVFQVMELAVRVSMRFWVRASRTGKRLIWIEARSSGKTSSRAAVPSWRVAFGRPAFFHLRIICFLTRVVSSNYFLIVSGNGDG